MTNKHNFQFQWQLNSQDLQHENWKSKSENQGYIGSPIFSASSDEISHLWQIRLQLKSEKYQVIFRLMDEPLKKVLSVQLHFEFSDFNDSVFLKCSPVIFTFGTMNNGVIRCGYGLKNQVSYDVLSSKSLNYTVPMRITVFLEFKDSPINSNSLYGHQSYQPKLFPQCQRQKYTDFSINCGGKLFHTHKLILASASPVFESLIDQLEEKGSYLIVNDVSPEVFEDLLEFVYTGKVSMDYEKAKTLLEAGDKYKLVDLQDVCLCKIESNLNVLTAVEILTILDKCCSWRKYIKAHVMHFIKANIADVMCSPAWKGIVLKRADLLDEIMRFIHL